MKKNFIDIEDNEIILYESDGEGQDTLLIHGNSLSSRSFIRQLEGSIGKEYHIIAIDLPGHGESLPATNPEKTYTLPGYAQIITSIISHLNILELVIVGHSLGGHIALETSELSSKIKGILIFGTPPIGKPPLFNQAFLPNPAAGFAFKKRIKEHGIKQYASVTIKEGSDIPQFYLDDIRKTDPNARYYLGRSMASNGFTNEIEIVSKLNIPLAVIHGANDQVINLNYIKKIQMPSLWKDNVQIIENAGHSPQWETQNEFNSILEEFIKEFE